MANVKKGAATEKAENVSNVTETADHATTLQTETVANDNKPAEPTSENLQRIQSSIVDKIGQMTAEPNFTKKLAFVTEIQKLQAEEVTEKNAIKKAIIDAKIQSARNEKLQLIDNLLEAYDREQLFFRNEFKAAAPEDATQPNPLMEQMNALTDGYKAAREKLSNLLIGTVSIQRAITGDAPTGGKGDTAKQIIASYEKHLATGLNDTDARKAVIAEGFSRGTTGAVVLAYRQEKGLA